MSLGQCCCSWGAKKTVLLRIHSWLLEGLKQLLELLLEWVGWTWMEQTLVLRCLAICYLLEGMTRDTEGNMAAVVTLKEASNLLQEVTLLQCGLTKMTRGGPSGLLGEVWLGLQ